MRYMSIETCVKLTVEYSAISYKKYWLFKAVRIGVRTKFWVKMCRNAFPH